MGRCSEDQRWILGVYLGRCVISILLPPGLGQICTSVWVFLCEFGAYFWSIFPLDCSWVTVFVKLLLAIIISFVCTYFLLFLFYFNAVYVFYIIRDSPCCDCFYYILILKAICLVLQKFKNWYVIHKKTLYDLCRYNKKY